MTDLVESKAKAALAYLMDHIVYSDSYGVHGSDFAACRLCNGGGAPGVPLVHEETCPAARYGDVVQEWWDERDEERKEAAAEISRLRDQLATSQGLCTQFENAVADDLGELLGLRAEIARLRAASEWRDISTAPRDGMNIDVFCRDGERVTNVYWRNGRWMRFWVNDFETLGHVKLESEPTHWMPLPAPPQRNEVKP